MGEPYACSGTNDSLIGCARLDKVGLNVFACPECGRRFDIPP